MLYCFYILNCKVMEFSSHCLQYFFINKSTWPSKILCRFLAHSSDWARTKLRLGSEIWLGILPKKFRMESTRSLRTLCGMLRLHVDSMQHSWGSVQCSIILLLELRCNQSQWAGKLMNWVTFAHWVYASQLYEWGLLRLTDWDSFCAICWCNGIRICWLYLLEHIHHLVILLWHLDLFCTFLLQCHGVHGDNCR